MEENRPTGKLREKFTLKDRKITLLIGDLIAAAAALGISLIIWARGDSWLGLSANFFKERAEIWFYFLPVLWLMMLAPLYDRKRSSSVTAALKYIGVLALVWLGIYIVIFFVAPPKTLPRTAVIVFIITAALLTFIWRWIYVRNFTAKNLHRTLIVGAGKAGTTIAGIINSLSPHPYEVVGFLDDDPEKLGTLIEGYPVLGGSDVFFEMVEKYGVSQIIMAISNHLEPEMFDALTLAEERGLTVSTMPKVYEDLWGRVPVYLLSTDWMLRSFFDACHAPALYEIAKRLMDIIGGMIGLVFLIILFPFIALATLIDSGRPIFYTQERCGLHGNSFNIIKFRTMVQNAEIDGVARPASEHDNRITKVGNFLRKSHLDEMPQFINVLKGDISLVGPRAERPEIIKDLQRGIPFYRGRLLVRPGITGWAQVNYGYASGTEQNAVKLEYDLYYIKHRNLIMDFSILLRTFRTIFGLEGR